MASQSRAHGIRRLPMTIPIRTTTLILALCCVTLLAGSVTTAERAVGGARSAATFAFRSTRSSNNAQHKESVALNPVAAAAAVAAVATVAASSVLLAPTHAFAAAEVPTTTADITRGSELFTANCAGCHGGGMNFVNEKRTLQKDALDKFIGGVDQPSVEKFFQGSSRHANMVYMRIPGGKLSEVDIVDVTSFVADQAGNDKW